MKFCKEPLGKCLKVLGRDVFIANCERAGMKSRTVATLVQVLTKSSHRQPSAD
ncbi:MAG: hypothetical protein ABIK18_05750 [candidate division WOR-3 bacterium]